MERCRNRKRPSAIVAAALGFAWAGWIASAAADTPPVSSKELFDWLKAGGYKDWAHENDPHPSEGSHPGAVRTFLNPSLAASLEAGAAAHPEGSTAVLELYGKRGALHGWAVSIKTQSDSGGGKGWYWYEVFSARDGNRTFAADRGVPGCFECHAKGRDFVMSPYPLK
ncbi:MAG: hypothetical protein ABW205_01285 [Burkholderiales bacterium]